MSEMSQSGQEGEDKTSGQVWTCSVNQQCRGVRRVKESEKNGKYWNRKNFQSRKHVIGTMTQIDYEGVLISFVKRNRRNGKIFERRNWSRSH